jgi:hypothetical protein
MRSIVRAIAVPISTAADRQGAIVEWIRKRSTRT